MSAITNIDFAVVAAIATEKFKTGMKESGKSIIIPDGPVYSPFDIECILAAIIEVSGALCQGKEVEA